MKSFLTSFSEGDPKIFREIYQSKASQCIRNDVTYKGGTPEEAEDVLVLAIMKVKELIKNGRYTEQENFYGFLRTVASYIYREERRKIYKAPYLKKEILVGEDFSVAEEGEAELYSYAEEFENLERKVAIHQSIKLLGQRDQEIIHLRYFKGLSLVDIGKRLGISQPNVAHFRILKRLKKLLKQQQVK